MLLIQALDAAGAAARPAAALSPKQQLVGDQQARDCLGLQGLQGAKQREFWRMLRRVSILWGIHVKIIVAYF